jgi:4-cresol dehydrogenase (hydroxylating)
MKNLFSARKAWARALGTRHVITDNENLARSGTATFATTQKVGAILFPADSAEVQACVRIANRYRIPLYPISGGQNCGYGTCVPYRDGSALIDLRRMNRITAYDDRLAYVRLEPGVTQQQLREFLQKKGGRLWIDPISTSPNCSVIGNILERGHGMTAYADRISSSCDLEVVLGNGTRFTTGNSGYRGATPKTAALDRWRAGPVLDGLFSQSGLGIVTQMSVWLMPAPEQVLAIGFTLDSDAAAAKVMDALRPLRLDGTIKAGPRIVNEYRHVQNMGRYPWEAMKGRVPLSEKVLGEITQKNGIPRWTGFVGLYGSPDQIEASRKRVAAALQNHIGKIHFLTPEGFFAKRDAATGHGDVLSRYTRAMMAGLLGEIIPASKRPYWRKQTPATGSFEQDGCGILWCPVSVPFDGAEMLQAVRVYRKKITAAGYEPDISISSIRERTLEVNVSIIFDREKKGEDRKALRCARELMPALLAKGFTPHRLGLHSMSAFSRSDRSYLETVGAIRRALDPNGVISVGRYLPAR